MQLSNLPAAIGLAGTRTGLAQIKQQLDEEGFFVLAHITSVDPDAGPALVVNKEQLPQIANLLADLISDNQDNISALGIQVDMPLKEMLPAMVQNGELVDVEPPGAGSADSQTETVTVDG